LHIAAQSGQEQLSEISLGVGKDLALQKLDQRVDLACALRADALPLPGAERRDSELDLVEVSSTHERADLAACDLEIHH
jgi:hypothetical protein